MARSKRLNRAEARRRYRAEHAHAAQEPEDDDELLDDEPEATSKSSKSTKATASTTRSGKKKETAQPPAKGFMGAMRAAYRPLDIRGDIAYIPTLVLRTKAVWVPTLMVIGGAIGYVLFPTQQLAVFAFQLLSTVPPVVPAFAAGFLAPRASYIAGIFIALVQAIVYGILSVTLPTDLTGGDQGVTAFGTVLGQILLLSIPTSSLYAAAAAWYRRFLAISSANRQRQMAADRKTTRQRR